MQTIAVIDFETTGLAPNGGGRATEIAAVLVRGGAIVDSFQSLMNSGAHVPYFIEQLTGISNQMLADAPPAGQVMREVARFTRGCPLVAHNAAFDRGFWLAELERAGCEPDPAHQFACTVLLARRLYPEAPNCRLGSLAQFHRLPDTGRAHRALADAQTTAHLLLRIQQDLARRFADDLGDDMPVEHELLALLQRAGKNALRRCVQQFAGSRQRHLSAEPA
jgi:DNA polymerase III subunit epsilon